MNIPEGWKLVPVEPTPSMIDAAIDREEGGNPNVTIYDDIYKAMLSAASTPPENRESAMYDLTAPVPFKPTPPEVEPVYEAESRALHRASLATYRTRHESFGLYEVDREEWLS